MNFLLLIFGFITINLNSNLKIKYFTQKMDNFLGRVQKEMIKLRKKNLNIMNEFKIQMFQARKNIDRQLIEKEYGKIGEENRSVLTQIDNQLSFMKKDTQSIIVNNNANKQSYNTSKGGSLYGYSTNHHSVVQNGVNGNEFSHADYHDNKENQDMNFRMKTDISVNEYESFGGNHNEVGSKIKANSDHFASINHDGLDLNALKNDESMEINTEDVKKKYLKFVSPSSGWTISAASNKEKGGRKGSNDQTHPLCTQFELQHGYFDTDESQSACKVFNFMGPKITDDYNFSRHNTIHELVEAEDFTQSINQ